MAQPKLLLLEDNPKIGEKLQRLLSGQGRQVYVASNGIDGLMAYNQLRPHLVILEQFLPLLSGEEVVRRLRAQTSPAQLPIVMLTSSRFGTISAQTRPQLNQIFTKPLQPQQLQAMVETLLQHIDLNQAVPPLAYLQEPTQLYILTGDLYQQPLPELFSRIDELGHTGVLTIQLPQGERRLSFSRGKLVYAESDITNEQFISLIHKQFHDRLSLQELEQMTAGSNGRAILQREALERSGKLPHGELANLFHYYVQEMVQRCLLLQSSPFHMVEDLTYAQRTAGSPLDLLLLLFESICRYSMPDDVMRELAPHMESLCHLAPAYHRDIQSLARQFPEFSLAPERIEGQQLQWLLRELSPDFHRSAQLLKTLLLARLLTLKPVNALTSQRLPSGMHPNPLMQLPQQPQHMGHGFPTPPGMSSNAQFSYPGSPAVQAYAPPHSGAVTQMRYDTPTSQYGGDMPTAQMPHNIPHTITPPGMYSTPHGMHPTGFHTGSMPATPYSISTSNHEAAVVHTVPQPHNTPYRRRTPSDRETRPAHAVRHVPHHLLPPQAHMRGIPSVDQVQHESDNTQHPPRGQRRAGVATYPPPKNEMGPRAFHQHPSQAYPSQGHFQKHPSQAIPAAPTGAQLSPLIRGGSKPIPHPKHAPVTHREGKRKLSVSQSREVIPLLHLPSREEMQAASRELNLASRTGFVVPVPREKEELQAKAVTNNATLPRTGSSAARLSPSMLQQLNRDFLHVQTKDEFRLFQITYSTDDEELGEVYDDLTLRYKNSLFQSHPNQDIRHKAQTILQRTQDAYIKLHTPEKRSARRRELEALREQMGNRLNYAKREYALGQEKLQAKQYKKAAVHFRYALEANSKEPVHALKLGWAIFRDAPNTHPQVLLAKTYIEQAMEQNPIIEESYLYLSLIRQHEGHSKDACTLLHRLLKLNPGHKQARQLLASFQKN